MQEQRRLIGQPLGRIGNGDHRRLRQGIEPRALRLGELALDEGDQRKVAQSLVRSQVVEEREPVRVARVDDDDPYVIAGVPEVRSRRRPD